MQEYEITYISAPDLTEDIRGELDASIETAISNLAGSVSYNSENVRRRLLYPIKKNVVGFVRTVQVSLEQAKAAELRDFIKKQAGILRLTMLATPRRQEVAATIFDTVAKQQTEPKKAIKSAKPITMEEVEEKIEEALEEEVK